MFKTDDFGTCLLFVRPKKDRISEIKLKLEDFNENEAEKYFQPVALDLGWKHVFVAIINDENDSS